MIGLTIFRKNFDCTFCPAIFLDRLFQRFVAIGLAIDRRDGEAGFEACLEGRAVPDHRFYSPLAAHDQTDAVA